MRRPTLDRPPKFEVGRAGEGHVLTLTSDTGALAYVFVLEDDIVRLLVLPDGAPAPCRAPGRSRPGQGDIADDGRDRFDVRRLRLARLRPRKA